MEDKPLKSSASAADAAIPAHIESIVHRVVNEASIIAITDRRGRIVYANDRFCELSGYAREELLGNTHRILKSGKHPDSYYKELWSTLLRGESWRGILCNRAKAGNLYYVDSLITPITASGGELYYLAVRNDITARVEAETRLAEQARKAEEEHRMIAVGRMANGIVHDLSNILTGILGVLEMPEAKEGKLLLRDAVQQMAKLTRTLRDFSSGRPTKPSQFKVNTMLGCAVSLVRNRAGAAPGLSIDSEVAASANCLVWGNEAQLFEVVLNLLVNAIEACSGLSSPRVVLSTVVEGNLLQVRVQDSGPGVAPSILPSLFDPYASTKGQGRGVGLSAAIKIASAHHGSLRLEHAGGGGRGACFLLELPVVSSELQVEPRVDPRGDVTRVILLSEDDAYIRKAVSLSIRELGFTVLAANDFTDLLGLAERHKDELVAAVLDSCDSESEGGELACLRQLSPRLPVVLISALLSEKGLGASKWSEVYRLPKPFSVDELHEAIRLAMGTTKASL